GPTCSSTSIRREVAIDIEKACGDANDQFLAPLCIHRFFVRAHLGIDVMLIGEREDRNERPAMFLVTDEFPPIEWRKDIPRMKPVAQSFAWATPCSSSSNIGRYTSPACSVRLIVFQCCMTSSRNSCNCSRLSQGSPPSCHVPRSPADIRFPGSSMH